MVVGHCLWGKKVKPVDAVCSGCSRIVVYGGGDIVFGAKRSNQWIQSHSGHSGHSWTCSGCSRIVVYGGGDIVLWCKKVKQWTQYTVDTLNAVTQWTQYTV